MNPEFSPEAPLEVLRRWEETGAVWRVLSTTTGGPEISLARTASNQASLVFDISDAVRLAAVGAVRTRP